MKILFQGDSITDCGRDRSDCHNLSGYSAMVAAALGGGHEYINLGISGNRSRDILDRYESDIKAVAPDIMTLLIGINDVWRRYDSNQYTSPAKFEATLRELFTRFKKDLPKAKLIVMEPFTVPVADKMHWRRDLMELIDVVRALSVEYADGFIPLDGIFAKAAMTVPYAALSADGVHPDAEGQKLIASVLAEEIRRFL